MSPFANNCRHVPVYMGNQFSQPRIYFFLFKNNYSFGFFNNKIKFLAKEIKYRLILRMLLKLPQDGQWKSNFKLLKKSVTLKIIVEIINVTLLNSFFTATKFATAVHEKCQTLDILNWIIWNNNFTFQHHPLKLIHVLFVKLVLFIVHLHCGILFGLFLSLNVKVIFRNKTKLF